VEELRIGSKTLSLTWFTGKVVGTTKNLETKVHGGGGGGYSSQGAGYTAPVAITSTTTVHDQLFLVDPSGKECSFQLQNFDLACRETHDVTVLWAAKKGKNTGYNVLVYNHTVNKAAYQQSSLSTLLKPWKLPYWIGALAVIYGTTAVAVGQIQSHATVSFGLVLLLWLAAIFVPIGIYRSLTSGRVKQFMSSINYKDLVARSP
jgi:hypothetical protein